VHPAGSRRGGLETRIRVASTIGMTYRSEPPSRPSPGPAPAIMPTDHVSPPSPLAGISRIGLGAMRLSIQGRPAPDEAEAVVRRAVELGITLVDTADVYALDDGDAGHNERLVAGVLRRMGAGFGGEDGAPRVVVATKGGMTRPGGRWERNGRPEHLRSACEASLRALGVDRIDLYQFHTPDPAVPFAESVGALARLRDEGKVAAVGLSNVTLPQIREAAALVPISSVQNGDHLVKARFGPQELGPRGGTPDSGVGARAHDLDERSGVGRPRSASEEGLSPASPSPPGRRATSGFGSQASMWFQ
jgi:hypothetical protein